MSKLKTYLCGAIECLEDSGESWRDKIAPKLEALGIVVQNPCKSECNKEYGTSIKENREQIKKFKKAGDMDSFDDHMDNVIITDIRAVINSDFILVYYNNDYKHGGTIDEIVHAVLFQIPIYCVNYGSKVDMNDWVHRRIRQVGIVFDNFGQALDYIKLHYKKEIKDTLSEQEKIKV